MTERNQVTCAVVVPTVGRPSLGVTLRSLAAQEGVPGGVGALVREVVVVDDRPPGAPALDVAAELPDGAPWPLLVLRSGGRGPAAARNVGWRSVGAGDVTAAPWVVFVDDDVVLPPGWARLLRDDLAAAPPDVAGVQARLEVPLRAGRPPTDWERNTKGLEAAAWITADMAYRRDALAGVGGFDERFPRAFREDADLALRVRTAGWRLARGRRLALHPVRPADRTVSLRLQRGTADDALLRALHGRDWRALAETGRGRFRRHVATVGAAALAAGGAAAGAPRVAAAGAAAWAALTAEFAVARIAPGPRPGDAGWLAEWATMAGTSVPIPFAAVAHRVRGTLRHRGAEPWPPRVRAVLLDRDGTLVEDVPYNGDPDAVRPVPGARAALDRLRGAGIAVGVVTNQSGVARGLLTPEHVAAVNARVAELLGPFDVVRHCPHGPDDGCACRKPAPGMVLDAAATLGVPPYACAVVGDIGADMAAAIAAGARGVLVPTAATRRAEVRAAPAVAADLAEAVDLLLGDRLTGLARLPDVALEVAA